MSNGDYIIPHIKKMGTEEWVPTDAAAINDGKERVDVARFKDAEFQLAKARLNNRGIHFNTFADRLNDIDKDFDIHVRWFMREGDKDATAAFQDAFDTAIVVGGGHIVGKSEAVYEISDTVKIDISYVTLDLKGALIKSRVLGKPTFEVSGGKRPVNNISYQNNRSFKNFTLQGPGRTSNSHGIKFHSPSGAVHGLAVYDIDVQEFGVGLSFHQNAYLLSFFDCSVGRCKLAVDMPAGHTNYGENIRFIGGVIANNELAFRNQNPNGNFHLTSVSVDYSEVFFDIQAGGVFGTDLHLETNNSNQRTTQPLFKLGRDESAKLVLTGGMLMFMNPPSQTDYIFYTEGTHQAGGIVINGLTWFQARPRSGILCGGTGKIEINNVITYTGGGNMSIAQIPALSHNKLADGGFEESEVIDLYISSGAQTLTSRQSVDKNIDPTLDNTVSFIGRKSLKVTKKERSFSSSFSLLVPVEKMKHHSYRFSVKRGSIQNGIMHVSGGYIAATHFLNGLPVYKKSLMQNSRQVNFATTGDWSRFASYSALNKAPAWATHFLVTFNCDSLPLGTFNIDDLIVTTI